MSTPFTRSQFSSSAQFEAQVLRQEGTLTQALALQTIQRNLTELKELQVQFRSLIQKLESALNVENA